MTPPATRARPSASTSTPVLAAVIALVLAGGCWTGGYGRNRELHYIQTETGEQQLVQTPAPPPAAYEAYLRARLALDREPPALDEARGHILDALRWQPDEPQLWTVKAEIEWKAGDFEAAEDDVARALALRPGYPEAQQLLAQIRTSPST